MKDKTGTQVPEMTEEERELLRRAQNGDRAARDRIVTAYNDRIVSVAAEYRDSGTPTEDLIQEGYIGLIYALDRCDPAQDDLFPRYAENLIRLSIARCVAEAKRQNRASAAGGVTPPGRNDAEDGTAYIDDMEERSAAKAGLRRLLSALTPEERNVLEQHFGLAGWEAQDDS